MGNGNARAQEALDALTARMIDAMESGPGAWTQPWRGALPANGVTGRRYSGSNILLLGLTAGERGFESNRWATFKQWRDAGCRVTKGERSSVVVFYTSLTVHDRDSDNPAATKRVPLLRYSSVFAAEQVDGEHASLLRAPRAAFDAAERAEAFFGSVGAIVRHGGDSAHYDKRSDAITLPPRAFSNPRPATTRRSRTSTFTGPSGQPGSTGSVTSGSVTTSSHGRSSSRNSARCS